MENIPCPACEVVPPDGDWYCADCDVQVWHYVDDCDDCEEE